MMQQSQKYQTTKLRSPSHQQGQSILHYAVSESKAQAVQLISDNYQAFVKQKNQDGCAPLMLAIFLNNPKIIKSLLPFSDKNTRDNNGNTLFMIAAANGNISACFCDLKKQKQTITANMSDQQSMNFSMDESHRIQPITIYDLSHLHAKIFQTSNPNPSAIINRCINVLATHKLSSKLILNTQFQQYLLEDPTNVDTVTIAIMGSKKIGKSFLLDCLLSLQTSTVCRIMSKSNQTIINSPIVLNKTKTTENKLVYFDCAGGISNQIFLWNYVISSAIVYNIGQNDIEAQKTLINGLRYIRDKIDMQKDNISLPELILVYRDSNNNITKSQLIKQISTYNLFQPRIKTINLPYPGQSNISAKQLLDISVKQIRNQFLSQTKQLLNHFISNVKPKIFKQTSLSTKILSLILQPLTTHISYCSIQQQDLSINKIWNQMIQNLSIGYYNFYLKCYEKELNQQFGNQEPKSKYDVFRKLREVKYKVEKKIQAFKNLDEQPVFNKYKDRLNHVIKSKQQLIKQVNREKSGLKNQEYCKKLLSQLDGKNAQKLVQQYLKTELDQQKSDVLIRTFQKTLQERSKYLSKSQQKQNLHQQIKQGEFQINDLRKRLQAEQQKTQNLKNVYNPQKKQASIEQKKQKIHELKDHLKSSIKMKNDKLNTQYFKLAEQSDRLRQRIEINGAQINKLRVKREEDLRSITKQLADKEKKLDQNIKIVQQKLRIAKSKKPAQKIEKVQKPQAKSKDSCCTIM